MLSYTYQAFDAATGKKVHAGIEAQSEQAAAKLLRERGLTPLKIELEGEKTGLQAFIQRIPSKQKIIFSRQLSTLINAGLPLVQSLRSVSDQTTNKKFQAVINKVITDVESGNSLASAMNNHPKVFDQIYLSLVEAGEASGTLDKSLERLANQQEKDAEVISKVRGALMYPLIVILAMVGLVTFMMITVLPQVENIYKGLSGVSLPIFTRILLSVSRFIIHDWLILIIGLAVLGFATTKYARSGPGKLVIDRLKMKMWPIGPLFMKLYMARFARTASTLVASGVPLLKTLTTTAKAVNNVHIENSILKATEKIKGGKNLSETLQGDPNFLDLVPSMIHIGEQSGSLEGMLEKVADYYEKEVDNQIKSISTIIEPVLMIFIGVIALIIVAAILLPIYSLAGKTIIK